MESNKNTLILYNIDVDITRLKQIIIMYMSHDIFNITFKDIT